MDAKNLSRIRFCIAKSFELKVILNGKESDKIFLNNSTFTVTCLDDADMESLQMLSPGLFFSHDSTVQENALSSFYVASEPDIPIQLYPNIKKS